MIIYLASFPRSGNTLCRQLIMHYFGRFSTSIYQDQYELISINKPEMVPDNTDSRLRIVKNDGEEQYRVLIENTHSVLTPEFRQIMASSDEIFFVKTHESPFDTYFEGEYVIRIVRHPAAALWSYYNYRNKIEGEKVDLESVIIGNLPGSEWANHLQWSWYTESWLKAEKILGDQCFRIKYEDLLFEADILINKIQQVTQLPMKKSMGTFPSFEYWRKKSPDFYRSGQTDEWKDKLTHDQIMLIYQYHAETMILEGYSFDFAPPPNFADDKTRIYLATLGMVDVANMAKVEAAGQIIEEGNLKYQVMFNGVKVPADSYYGPWYTELIQKCDGHHEPQEEYIFDQLVKNAPEGAKMIELGSYWAFYSTWFLTHVKNSQAILVEPQPDNIAVSLATLALNKCRANIELAAVGARDIIFEEIFIGGAQQPNYEIPLLSVDELMVSYDTNHLYLLHSDIQGAEVKMLEGARDALKNQKIDYLVISTHSEKLHHKCLQILETFNYHIVAEHDTYESYTYDGLIVARSDQAQELENIAIHKRTPAEWTWEEAKEAWAHKEIYLKKHQEILYSSELKSELIRLRENLDQLFEQTKFHELEISRLKQEISLLDDEISVRELNHHARAEKLYSSVKRVEFLENKIEGIRHRKITKIMRRLGKPLL